jgi:hypothetical protein
MEIKKSSNNYNKRKRNNLHLFYKFNKISNYNQFYKYIKDSWTISRNSKDILKMLNF